MTADSEAALHILSIYQRQAKIVKLKSTTDVAWAAWMSTQQSVGGGAAKYFPTPVVF